MDRPAAPEKYGTGKTQLNPRHRRTIKRRNRAMRHRDRDQRKRQRRAQYHPQPQSALLCAFARRPRQRVARKIEVKPRARNTAPNIARNAREISVSTVEINAHLARRKRHAHFAHAAHRARRRFDLRRARRAVHPLNGNHPRCPRAVTADFASIRCRSFQHAAPSAASRQHAA